MLSFKQLREVQDFYNKLSFENVSDFFKVMSFDFGDIQLDPAMSFEKVLEWNDGEFTVSPIKIYLNGEFIGFYGVIKLYDLDLGEWGIEASFKIVEHRLIVKTEFFDLF